MGESHGGQDLFRGDDGKNHQSCGDESTHDPRIQILNKIDKHRLLDMTGGHGLKRTLTMTFHPVPHGEILFHLAFPVTDIEATKRFYRDGLGCELGRETESSLIMNLGGHQLVAHLVTEDLEPQQGIYPRHFGLVCRVEKDWEQIRDRAQSQGLNFRIPPKLRFQGSSLEHSTFFLEDPSHNLLEFKFYRHDSAIFGQQSLAMVGEASG